MPDSYPVLTRRQARDVDRRALRDYGLSGLVLMENAGRGCAVLLERLGINGPVCICTGKGNNGGDGYVIARHLDNSGHQVRVASAVDPDTLTGDAAVNHGAFSASGGTVSVIDPVGWDRELVGADWIVDALLGTGTRGDIRSPFIEAIDAINRTSSPVLAIDLPSGIDCDTGSVLGTAVQARHTATFVAAKQGFQANGLQDWIGEVHIIDIGIPRSLREEVLK